MLGVNMDEHPKKSLNKILSKIQIERLGELKSSQTEGDRREAIALIEQFLDSDPLNALHWYDKACCHDFLGEEELAEPSYRKVYEMGWKNLPFHEQGRFFIGFGSTLRNNGKIQDSINILEEGCRLFSEFPALKIFLALSFYSQSNYQRAAEILLTSSVDVSAIGLGGYERAIRFYSENLNGPTGEVL
jgi:tetratricopeptide (TPR) repeat protein